MGQEYPLVEREQLPQRGKFHGLVITLVPHCFCRVYLLCLLFSLALHRQTKLPLVFFVNGVKCFAEIYKKDDFLKLFCLNTFYQSSKNYNLR